MAHKKKATKKKFTAKFAAKKSQEPSTPSKPQYNDVLTARGEWECALGRVETAQRALRRVRADHSDFKARDLRVADAEDVLARTRVLASAAKREFTQVKAAAR